MRDLTQENITQAVIDRFADTPDPRLKEVITGLVQHLHAFAREVKLTEEEWLKGIQFLTHIGHTTDHQRQEFILLSDTLGLSTLTVAINNECPDGCTEATVLGPFYAENAPLYELGEDIAKGAAGVPCTVRGSVCGQRGEPVQGAEVHVWQADAEGKYDTQRSALPSHQARGVLRTDSKGQYHFRSILAEAYPIPDDGPVGDMLRATNRHPWRPAHLHFMIRAPGYQTLITHVFRDGDPYLDSDAVFGVRQRLVADWSEQPDGTYLVEYDFVIKPVRQAART